MIREIMDILALLVIVAVIFCWAASFVSGKRSRDEEKRGKQ